MVWEQNDNEQDRKIKMKNLELKRKFVILLSKNFAGGYNVT